MRWRILISVTAVLLHQEATLLTAGPPGGGLGTLRQLAVVETGSAPDNRARPGRRVLRTIPIDGLWGSDLSRQAVALPQANTSAPENLRGQRFGIVETGEGRRIRFNPEIVLVKFRGQKVVSAVRVEAGLELAAAVELSKRQDVEFAELDLWQYPAYQPNDPLLSAQWHHGVLHSFQAWDLGLGSASVRIGIVDTPFQMDHPDLAANTSEGWDILLDAPITAAGGITHSTLAAGLAAGVIGNGVGIAGAGNCRLVPISISDTDPSRTVLSQMYDAVIWAADHGVRVVNMSWTGGDSDTLNAAGAYLKERARGILVMAGGNTDVPVYATNQPDIYCVSMTDAADNMRSRSGEQVDFAAPGWAVYSTVTNGGYAYGTGTSYSAPLVAGVIAQLFSINPLLGPEEVIEILQTSAADLGPPGKDEWFGWGRIDFGRSALEAYRRLPRIEQLERSGQGFGVSARFNPSWSYTLWRSGAGAEGPWHAVPAATSVAGDAITLTDPGPSDEASFYRISIVAP